MGPGRPRGRRGEITHTIIRVKGMGLLRKPTKTAAGERVLGVPATALAMLRRRFNAWGRLDLPVFPDSLGGFRDPANVRRDIRDARGEDALAWITSHNFRKTTATVLDAGDFSAREIADQLGHSRPSMTQDVYMGRKVRNPRVVLVSRAPVTRRGFGPATNTRSLTGFPTSSPPRSGSCRTVLFSTALSEVAGYVFDTSRTCR